MGTQASFTREGGSLIFSGSSSNAEPGFGTTGGPSSGTPSLIYNLRWNAETFALEVQRTADGAWEVLLQFENYYFPNELT